VKNSSIEKRKLKIQHIENRKNISKIEKTYRKSKKHIENRKNISKIEKTYRKSKSQHIENRKSKIQHIEDRNQDSKIENRKSKIKSWEMKINRKIIK
jgi:hypothetical protein